ncbi:MAG: hypothetical protein JOZ80_14705 [Acidobacteriaceae bacterium]|nr:hypothetical protein [Acidobacteriaceae bacterium]
MKRSPWAAAVLSLFVTTTFSAQDAPRIEVAISYSRFQVLQGYTIGMDGGSVSGAWNFNSWLGLAGDFGAYHGYPSQSLTGETFTLGPRVTYRRFPRFEPFAPALVGGSHFNASSGGVTGGGLPFAFAGGFGADITPHRDGWFAFRLADDFFVTRSGGANTLSNRLSAGIVFRFGRK